MINIFEMIDNALHLRNKQQYCDIGKPITEDNKKQLLGLSADEGEIYDNIRQGDRNRLNGIFNEQAINQARQAENNNTSGIMIQIL